MGLTSFQPINHLVPNVLFGSSVLLCDFSSPHQLYDYAQACQYAIRICLLKVAPSHLIPFRQRLTVRIRTAS